jgi:hypothetical protein
MTGKLSITGCEKEDVLAFSTGMYRADQITQAFDDQIKNISARLYESLKAQKIDIHTNIYQEGIDCEVLGVNSTGWRQGKVKVKFELEFIPDEVEEVANETTPTTSDSSLDSLRAVTD